jgi:hypothetical protein
MFDEFAGERRLGDFRGGLIAVLSLRRLSATSWPRAHFSNVPDAHLYT